MTDKQPPRAQLQGLSPEIRNEIYHWVVVGDSDVHFIGSEVLKLRKTSQPTQDAVAYHSLAQTCKQLRKEFRPVYVHDIICAASRIYLHVKNFDLRLVRHFLRVVNDSTFLKDKFSGKDLTIALHFDDRASVSLEAVPKKISAQAYHAWSWDKENTVFTKVHHEAFFSTQKKRKLKKSSVTMSSADRLKLRRALRDILEDWDSESKSQRKEYGVVADIMHAIWSKHNKIQKPFYEARQKNEYTKARARVIRDLEAEGWTLTQPGPKA